ncbi:MAG: heavy metal translocating P-type ATPase [Acetatifactor sp.]|nr:heavy metal translocating P-type ATPase [Acetatifactor sp.]
MKERYHISGMTCSACSSHVEKAVNKLAGVERASVNLLTETMEVSYDEGRLTEDDIIAAVEKAGYGASLILGGVRNPVPVKTGRQAVCGASCGGNGTDTEAGAEGSTARNGESGAEGSAAGTVESSAEDGAAGNRRSGAANSGNGMSDGVPGNMERGLGENTGRVGAGRSARSTARGSVERKAKEEARAMKWRLGISIGFLIPLMYVAMYHMYNEWFGLPIPGFVHRYLHGNANAMTFAMTQLLLLLPIVYMNRKFFSVGFKTIRHLSPNMDSLIALGASAAIGYGIFAMYRISYGLGHGDMALVEQYSHDLYFESAGMILTLITVGKYLESRSKGKTSEAITKLMDLSPKTAILLTAEGQELEVPTETLQTGDIFLIKPGSLVPADGTVLEGNSSIDEAAITGESIPVEKQAGDKVVSATVNKSGFLKCRADRVGEDTTLSQIIRLVEEASASKAPIAQLADKVAGVFVPVVMGIALVTLAAWLLAGAGAEFAISSAIAVLVISCPCALGRATPVAIMVGTGVGANHGILIKSGEALQQAKEIDTVVMDKTGTITSGKLRFSGCGCYVQDLAVDTLLQIAAALEKKSEHPLAEAILERAQEDGVYVPEIRDFKAVPGRGIEGVLAEDIPPRPMFPGNDGPTAVFVAGKNEDGSVLTEVLGEKEAETVMAENRSGKEAAADTAENRSGKKAAADTAEDRSRKEATVDAAADQSRNGASAVTREHRNRGDAARLAEEARNRMDRGWKAGTRFLVGNRAYMEENGITVDPIYAEGLDAIAAEGRTPLLVAAEGELLGEIDVSDGVKAGSHDAIRRFREMGIRVVMLTGDNRRTAEAVRRQLHIEEVIAEVLPQDKEKKIREVQKSGRKVAMIGDGINDAPALAAADVGMAIGAGTDVAMESADIVLMKSDLRDAVTAVRLSRAVIRNIKQNLFWAFFYNAIGIPLAAGVWYPLFGIRLNPMFGAAAMSLSSVFVVGNALRLRGFKSGFAKEVRTDRAADKEVGEAHAADAEQQAAGRAQEVSAERQAAGRAEAVGENKVTQSHAAGVNKITNQESEDKKMTKVMTIEGMMCGHCTGRVQKALEEVAGVSAVTMSLEDKTATVELAGEVADETLTAAVTEAGYEVKGIA